LLLSIPAGAAPLETDAELFDFCMAAAGWRMPDGFALQGFLRDDLNADGVVDVVAVLRHSAGFRMMAIFLSGLDGYRVLESAHSLPPDYGNGADPLLGVEIASGQIVLVIGGGANGEQRQSRYIFAENDGRFALVALSTTLWDKDSGLAEQHRFDFSAGEYSTVIGRMSGDAFMPEGVRQTNLFTPEAVADCLEHFDIGGFPVTWEAFVLQGDNGSAAPEPTALIYCSVCGRSFPEGQAFREHVCDEESWTSLVCAECGQEFESEQALAGHPCAASAPKTVVCAACGESFAEPIELVNHVCISYPTQGLMYCDVCGRSYPEGEAFRNHQCVAE